MTVGERAPRAGGYRPAEDWSGPAGPVESAGPVTPPAPPPPGRPDERTTVRNLVARLRASYPTLDALTVEAAVGAAYDSFHRARVRAYIPILVERRSRRTLDAACRAAPDDGADGGGAIAPDPARRDPTLPRPLPAPFPQRTVLAQDQRRGGS
ncbi:three-helix bundle dimerization domain-containing protein [Streptomyces sp. NPDC059104]|uniref:three-helix bundle dimerization domain-containing protein n=1 Tax=Streptomyces sp. NPDC059104 TaxID=3346729 RepID=UPI0036B88F66